MSEISIELASQYRILTNRLAKSHNIQNYRVYNLYAKTNMALTGIVCPIFTVNLGGARFDLVALDSRTSGPVSTPGWTLLDFFSSSSFSFTV